MEDLMKIYDEISQNQVESPEEGFVYEDRSGRVFQIKNIMCIGAGYVGTLTMTVLANFYPNVNFRIYDKFKPLLEKWNKAGEELSKKPDLLLDSLAKPQLPIVEKHFEELFMKVFNKNLTFTGELDDDAVNNADVIFICVNTPSTTNYKIKTENSIEDLQKEINHGIELCLTNVFQSVEELCEKIFKNRSDLPKEKILVQKSTVPIETLKKIRGVIKNYIVTNKCLDENILNDDAVVDSYIDKYCKLVNIPEFLAEGSAINNLIYPDRVVLGHLMDSEESQFGASVLRSFYEKWVKRDQIIEIDSISSEMTKLVSNAFLGQRISSINTVSELCEVTGANVHKIAESVGMDNRIGRSYLKASMGFGGSCLKKDILSLIYIFHSKNLNIQANYWSQVILINEYQRLRICNLILKAASASPQLRVSIFGISFKGNTNDVRQSNSVLLISYLLKNKISLSLYDPYVKMDDLINELKLYEGDQDYNRNECLKLYDDYYEAAANSSVVVFCNNHSIFGKINLSKLAESMEMPCSVFDLYDNFDLNSLKEENFKVFKLGVYSDM